MTKEKIKSSGAANGGKVKSAAKNLGKLLGVSKDGDESSRREMRGGATVSSAEGPMYDEVELSDPAGLSEHGDSAQLEVQDDSIYDEVAYERGDSAQSEVLDESLEDSIYGEAACPSEPMYGNTGVAQSTSDMSVGNGSNKPPQIPERVPMGAGKHAQSRHVGGSRGVSHSRTASSSNDMLQVQDGELYDNVEPVQSSSDMSVGNGSGELPPRQGRVRMGAGKLAQPSHVGGSRGVSHSRTASSSSGMLQGGGVSDDVGPVQSSSDMSVENSSGEPPQIPERVPLGKVRGNAGHSKHDEDSKQGCFSGLLCGLRKKKHVTREKTPTGGASDCRTQGRSSASSGGTVQQVSLSGEMQHGSAPSASRTPPLQVVSGTEDEVYCELDGANYDDVSQVYETGLELTQGGEDKLHYLDSGMSRPAQDMGLTEYTPSDTEEDVYYVLGEPSVSRPAQDMGLTQSTPSDTEEDVYYTLGDPNVSPVRDMSLTQSTAGVRSR